MTAEPKADWKRESPYSAVPDYFVGQHSGCGGPVLQLPGCLACCAWCGKLNPRMPKRIK